MEYLSLEELLEVIDAAGGRLFNVLCRRAIAMYSTFSTGVGHNLLTRSRRDLAYMEFSR